MSYEKISALYVFCSDYHSGQNSRLYRILSRIAWNYRPKLTDSAWQEARESGIYKELERRYA